MMVSAPCGHRSYKHLVPKKVDEIKHRSYIYMQERFDQIVIMNQK